MPTEKSERKMVGVGVRIPILVTSFWLFLDFASDWLPHPHFGDLRWLLCGVAPSVGR